MPEAALSSRQADHADSRWFWVCQAAGWPIAGLAVLPVAANVFGSLSLAAALVAARETMGLLLTSALRPWFRSWQDRGLGPALLAARALPAIVLVTAIDALLFLALTKWLAGSDGQAANSLFMRGMTYVAWTFLYFWLRETIAARHRERRFLELQLNAARQELAQLRAQIHPHFLFNALTLIIAEAQDNPPLVQKAAQALADLLHYLLRAHEETVLLTDELEAIQNYLAVEQARHGDKLQVAWQIDRDLDTILIPIALLIPLVENALKYGFHTSPFPCRITIGLRRIPGEVTAIVENSGAWVEPHEATMAEIPGTGTGLTNLRRRLEALYGKRASVLIETPAGLVRVIVKIPLDPSINQP